MEHVDYPHEAGSLYDCPACEDMWWDIVFMQGDEAEEVLDRLLRFDGVVTLQGVTSETIAEAVEYLSQWDFGDESEHDAREGGGWGSTDETRRVGDYVLSWNYHLSYVSLSRKVLPA